MSGTRPTATEELVAGVVARFGMVGVRGWRDLGGSWTTNLRLAGTPAVVARVYRTSTPVDRVVALQSVRTALADAGLPTVRPLRSADGETVATLSGGQAVELEPYVDWDARMCTADLLRTGHRLLARLHDVLRDIDIPAAALSDDDANYLSAADAPVLSRRGARRIHSWGDAELDRYAEEVVAHLDRVVAAEEPLSHGELIQPVHGDYWDNNVLFAGGRVAALLDLGFLGRRTRVDDLALTAYFFLLEPGKGLPSGDDLRHICSFADAYDAAAAIPLSRRERLSFPLVIARQPAWSIGKWVLRNDEPLARKHAREAASELPVAQAILADLPRWQSVLAPPGGSVCRTPGR
ncbi:MAG: phosphotransferase enzyme family protein [Propionibacteriaceae bacterium]